LKNGFGVYRFASGALYTGTFKDNVYSGQGEYRHASGAIFVGEYKEGERNGYVNKISYPQVIFFLMFFSNIPAMAFSEVLMALKFIT
jgi:MORN repeat